MSEPARLRVAIDGTPLLGPRTGIGHTTAALVQALAVRDELALSAFAITWRGREDLDRVLPPGVRAAARPLPARAVRALWLRTPYPPVEWWTGRVDVVHATNFVAPPTRAATLVTVHDLTFATRPDLVGGDAHQYPVLLQRAVERGAVVHTVSDHVAARVRAELGLSGERVVRVYPGLLTSGQGDPAAGRRVAGFQRYVLFLGQVEPRKNLTTLVRAFDVVADSDPETGLVLAGPGGPDDDAVGLAIDGSRHHSRMRRLGYVGDRERLDLLAGARAFAFPSLDEGFGHPPLEAMAARVPVVASAAGAIPEILGDAARLVEPLDADALATELGRVLDDEHERATLVARGLGRVGRYSWEQAARELTTLYRRLAGR